MAAPPTPGLMSRSPYAALLAFAVLAAPPPSGAEPLFEQIAPEKSGVTFVPKVRNDHPLSYLYHSGFVVGGVALGDLDGDGLPDLIIAGAADRNHVYLNRGDFRFEEVTDRCGPGMDGADRWTTGVTLVDIDGDGDLDIYFCNYQAPNQLMLNEGLRDGVPTFRDVAEEVGLAAIDSSHSASFVDYDGDGDLDMFLLTNRIEDPQGFPSDERSPAIRDAAGWRLKPGMERYYALWKLDETNFGVEAAGTPDILFNNSGRGPGGLPIFTDVTAAAGIEGYGDGLSATWWDYNRDGHPDLFVGNDFLTEDRLWHNNGDGTFTNVLPSAAPHTAWFSMGADAGDLNNDLLPDFFLADMAATTHYKSKTTMGAMGGTNLLRSISSTPPQYMRNLCLVGTGTDRFLEAAYLLGVASTDWTWAVKFADFDLDGRLDIYVTNGVIREMNHSDREIDDASRAGSHLWEFYKDLPMQPEQHIAYRNAGNLRFDDVSTEWGLDRTAVTYGCATADLDGDGDLDLVEVNLEEPPTIYRNRATGNRLALKLEGLPPNTGGIGAEVTLHTAGGLPQLRQLYPVSGYHSCNEPLVQFGLGPATTADEIVVRWPSGKRSRLTDVAANQTLVVREGDASIHADAPAPPPDPVFGGLAGFPTVRHQEVPFDDYADQILLPHALSQMGPALAWSDVDGDGQADFFLGGGAGQVGQIRLGDGAGGYKGQWVEALRDDKESEDMGAVFFDADGDGDIDLLVASGSSQFARDDPALEDRLYLNDGSGNLTRAGGGALPTFREASGPVAAADFDRDGATDVFIGSRSVPGAYPETPKSRLLRNTSGGGTATFTDVTEEVGGAALRSPGMVSAAVWSDIDGDGWQDLLLAIEWGRIRLFMNREGKLEEWDVHDDLARRTGWWTSVTTADLDGDGDLDIVAGNFGLNTKYKEATPTKPRLLYYGDLDGSGSRNIVEVKREGDTLYPERGRSCSSTAMPILAEKFPTYHAFAKASLSEVYGGLLDEAERFEANTLASGIFWNEGADGFRFEELPRIAQVAPVFGIGIADFDADGTPDLLLAQNFHAPQIETGHYDGGLGQLLLNDGHGKMLPVRADQSGVVIPGDAMATAIADLDGDGAPDAAVTVNGGTIQALGNRRSARERYLPIHLPPHRAPGAHVTVRWDRPGKDPAVRIQEYHAGGGYLSQSQPVLWFAREGATCTVTIRWSDGNETTSEPGAGAESVVAGPDAR